MNLEIPRALVAQSIDELQWGGLQNSERVLIWLGRRKGDTVLATEVFVPEQFASYDYFNIPPRGMRALLAHLRENALMVAAQVHSHPAEAFHSEADDSWAIVRHQGALSLVLPYFARDTTVENFLEMSATFSLSARNEWCRVSWAQLARRVRLQ